MQGDKARRRLEQRTKRLAERTTVSIEGDRLERYAPGPMPHGFVDIAGLRTATALVVRPHDIVVEFADAPPRQAIQAVAILKDGSQVRADLEPAWKQTPEWVADQERRKEKREAKHTAKATRDGVLNTLRRSLRVAEASGLTNEAHDKVLATQPQVKAVISPARKVSHTLGVILNERHAFLPSSVPMADIDRLELQGAMAHRPDIEQRPLTEFEAARACTDAQRAAKRIRNRIGDLQERARAAELHEQLLDQLWSASQSLDLRARWQVAGCVSFRDGPAHWFQAQTRVGQGL